MSESNKNSNSFRTYLQNNNGHKLLDADYDCVMYYNNNTSKCNMEMRQALMRLVQMQKNAPIQYMLSVKALLD